MLFKPIFLVVSLHFALICCQEQDTNGNITFIYPLTTMYHIEEASYQVIKQNCVNDGKGRNLKELPEWYHEAFKLTKNKTKVETINCIMIVAHVWPNYVQVCAGVG